MHWTGRALEVSASSPAAPSARWCPRPTTALAGLLLGMLLAIGACTVVPPDVEPPIGTATIGPDAGTVTVVPGVPHSGLMLREVGEPAGVGDVVLLMRAPEATPSEAVDGVRTLTWQYATDVLGEPTEPVVAAAPEGGFFEVLGDGSVLVLDADGRAVAAAAPPSASGARARWDVGQPDLLRLSVVGSRGGAGTGGTAGSAEGTPGSSDGVVQVSVTLSDRALASAMWGEREGGRSLAVEPTEWARHAGEAALELLWAQVVAAQPEADTDGMHDQLVCHALGAPDKATWNLEPWRPDVGLLGVLAAACNPT